MAQRRLNKNLVVGLVLGLMVVSTVAVIGLLLVYRGPEKDASPYVRMAIEAYRAGNLANAIQAYGKAYAQTKQPIWLVAQGQAARDSGDPGLAVRLWDRAVTDDPSLLSAHACRVRLRLELVGAYGSTTQSMALRTAAQALLDHAPDHPLGHFGLGIALTGLEQEDPKNMETGIAEMEKAQALSPADREIGTSLAGVYEIMARNSTRDKKPREARTYCQKAEAVFLDMIKADPGSAGPYLAFADFLTGRLRYDIAMAKAGQSKFTEEERQAALKQIEERLLKAKELDPKSAELGMRWADYWHFAGEPEKVVASLEETIRLAPSHLDAYDKLSRRHRAMGNRDKALAVIESALAQEVERFGHRGGENKNKRFTMLCLACEISLEQARLHPDEREKRLKAAEDYYNQAIAERSAEHWLSRQVEGQLREAQGRLWDAQRAYEAANDRLSWHRGQALHKFETLLKMAVLYLELQTPGEAIRILDLLLERDPTNRRARLLRAEAFLRTNKAAEAVDDAKRVLLTFKDDQQDHPHLRRARLIAISAYGKLGKVDEAKKLQEKLGDKTAGDRLRQANILQLEGKNEAAGEVLKALLKEDPANVVVLNWAINFFVGIDQRGEAKKLLAAAQAAKPDLPVLKRLALILDDKLTKEQRDQRLLELVKETEDEFSREMLLHEYYRQRNDAAKALAHLQAARKLRPDNRKLLEREFALALKLKDWDRADRCWEEAVPLNADGAGGRFFKGRILLVQAEVQRMEADRLASKDPAKRRELKDKAEGLYAEAAKWLREGIVIYDKSSNAYLWLGAAEEGLGNVIDARDAYSVAAELDPTNGLARCALAKLGQVYQNVPNAEEHLKEAIRLAPKDSDGIPLDRWLRMQVENQREQKDPRSAIARREKVRKEKPTDIHNLMRLALLYERAQEFDKADKCVAEAIKAEPKNLVLAWDASGYYRRREQDAKAEALLRGMVKQAEGNEKARAQVMVARHFVRIRQRMVSSGKPIVPEQVMKVQEAADRAYALAVQFPDAPASVYAEAAWFCKATRRQRAAAEWFRKALDIVKDESYEMQVRRWLIRLLLSNRPVPVDATKEVTDYVKRFPEDPMGLLFRGELFAAQGKLTEAIGEHTTYLDEISRQDRGPSQPARMAEGYYLRGQLYLRRARSTHTDRKELLRSAIRDLGRAKAIAPPDFRQSNHRVLLAQAMELMGQYDQAVRELRAVLAEQEREGEARPVRAVAARELVRLYGRLERWQEQEALIHLQMNLFPKSWYWQFVLGSQMHIRGRDEQALTPLRKACELLEYKAVRGPASNQPLVLLLEVLEATNRHKEIIDIVKTKLKPENQTSDVLTFYAGALARTGKAGEALANFVKAAKAAKSWTRYGRVARHAGTSFGLQRAIRLFRDEHAKQAGKDPVPTLLLSTLLTYEKKYEEALPLVAQAAEATKDPAIKAVCFASQGILLNELGRKTDAAKVYGDALKLNPNELTVLNNLAYMLAEDLKKPREALGYAQRAAALASGDPYVLDTFGWCLFLAGREQDALGILLEAVDRDPELLDPRLHLARIYHKQGQERKAGEELRAVLKQLDEREDKGGRERVLKVMKELGIQS